MIFLLFFLLNVFIYILLFHEIFFVYGYQALIISSMVSNKKVS